MQDRMFQVLVVGGMALVGCGGAGATGPERDGDAAPLRAQDADASDAGGSFFPLETNAGPYDASFSPVEIPEPVDAISIGYATTVTDASVVLDASEDRHVFPLEGPR
jgi:hypothetical protein